MSPGRLIPTAIFVFGILTSAVIAQDSDRTVLVPVSVLGAGRARVSGLKQENFQLLEENKEQKIAFFSPDNSPLSIGIILGAGALVRADRVSQSILDAVDAFKKAGNPSNEYFVEPYGTAGVEGAAERGLARLAQSANRRKILVMFIDSLDNPGGNPEQPSMDPVLKQDVPIYFVFMRDAFFRLSGTPSTVQDGQAYPSSWLTVYEDVARNTGGRLMYAEPAGDLKPACVELAEELKNQYVLGFTSRNDSPGGKWRNLKVNVTAAGQPKFILRYKARLFVPKPGKP
jgi:Ca-activated chloride channel family protein